MKDPLVSIIIPTYNSERYFAKTLASLALQSYRNFETIVVDKGSNDKTKIIVEKYQQTLPHLYFFTAGTERTSQFNYGVKKSKGTILYYIGSDYELGKGVVAAATAE